MKTPPITETFAHLEGDVKQLRSALKPDALLVPIDGDTFRLAPITPGRKPAGALPISTLGAGMPATAKLAGRANGRGRTTATNGTGRTTERGSRRGRTPAGVT